MRLSGVRPASLRDAYRALEQDGVALSLTKKNHVRMQFPNGTVNTGPLTSGDSNAAAILRKSVRRWNGHSL